MTVLQIVAWSKPNKYRREPKGYKVRDNRKLNTYSAAQEQKLQPIETVESAVAAQELDGKQSVCVWEELHGGRV